MDFELFWGLDLPVRLSKEKKDLFNKTRTVIPKILKLFAKYDISATWAVVGLLLTNDLHELELPDENVFPKYDNRLSRNYEKVVEIRKKHNDFSFLNSIDLVREIFQSQNQELASHTFSHYYCLENGQNIEDFRADLDCVRQYHIELFGAFPQSIVFPRNQVNYLELLEELNYKFYRGTQDHWAYESLNHSEFNNVFKRIFRLIDMYLPLHDNTFDVNAINDNKCGLYNIRQSRLLLGFIKSRKILECLRIIRIKNSMLSAAKNRKSFHLWWHPHNFGTYPNQSLKILESILIYYNKLRSQYDFKSLNMSQAIT